MPSVCYTLFVPGLLDASSVIALLPKSEIPECKALDTFLSRARITQDGPREVERGLFELFGINTDKEPDPPVAAITRLMEVDERDPSWWLRADPVYVQADRSGLVMLAHEELQLTQQEADVIVAEINQHFSEEGWQLLALCPSRWYLRSEQEQHIVTTPLAQVMGRDIHAYLPQGKDASYWHGVINELQMLLHGSRVNTAREENDCLPINSLWLWGGGCLPEINPSHWQGVWSDNLICHGLAKLLGVEANSISVSGNELLVQESTTTGDHLLVIEGLVTPLRNKDINLCLQQIKLFNDDWVVPLSVALRDGTCESITLLPGNGSSYHMTSKTLRRWWKLRRNFSNF